MRTMAERFGGEPRPPGLTYLPQLDGLRFLAASAVMVQHWVTNLLFPAPLGYAGVTLFFVLSGFLVTCILLTSKARHAEHGLPASSYFRNFYARRALRIFPLYILVIVLLGLCDRGGVRENAWWFLTHTINIKFFLQGDYDPWVNHLWTLAIEEQFYFAYPLVIFLTPLHRTKRTLLGLVAFSLATKTGLLWAGYTYRAIGFFTFGCFDAFAVGGLIGYLYTYERERLREIVEKKGALIAIAIAFAVAVPVRVSLGEAGSYQAVWFRLLVSSLSAWIVTKATFGFTGPWKAFLEHPWVSYLGKISYGIYVYHNFMAYITADMCGEDLARSIYMAPLYFFATVAVSAASWRFFESPVNELKNRLTLRLR